MKRLLRLLRVILKAAVFFTLFAFALNNQQETRVHFFFGTYWQAPTVVVVLAAFVLGLISGVLGMVPRWWRQRQAARRQHAASDAPAAAPAPDTPAAPAAAGPVAMPAGLPASTLTPLDDRTHGA
jgi:putative membrane protein